MLSRAVAHQVRAESAHQLKYEGCIDTNSRSERGMPDTILMVCLVSVVMKSPEGVGQASLDYTNLDQIGRLLPELSIDPSSFASRHEALFGLVDVF